MSDTILPTNPEAEKIHARIGYEAAKRIFMEEFNDQAKTSWASVKVSSCLEGNDTRLVIYEAYRHSARVRLRVSHDMNALELQSLMRAAYMTLGRIVRQMDYDAFAGKKIIEDSGKFYIERRDGTCIGLSQKEGIRFNAMQSMEKPSYKLKRSEDYAVSYIDPALPNWTVADDKAKGEAARLTKQAADEERRRLKEEADARALRLEQEKADFYENAGYGLF